MSSPAPSTPFPATSAVQGPTTLRRDRAAPSTTPLGRPRVVADTTGTSGPLATAERAFALLTASPSSLVIDGGEVPGLGQRTWSLEDLRAHLLSDGVPRSLRDATWRHLVTRARRDGPAWVIGCVGVAMPGLRRAAARLRPGWPGEIRDLDAELLTGFLDRLRVMDLEGPRVCGRLIDAGVRAARTAREAEAGQTEVIRVLPVVSLAPARPWDHPDWVLARAQAAAVICPEEHLLIGATRLEDVPLAEVAAHLQVSVSYASTWRARCEARLAKAIAAGEVDVIRRRPRNLQGDPTLAQVRPVLAACQALESESAEPDASTRGQRPVAEPAQGCGQDPTGGPRAAWLGPVGLPRPARVSCGAPNQGLGDGDRSVTTPRPPHPHRVCGRGGR